MVSKRELYKIAIVSATTIFMIVNIVSAENQPVVNTTIIWENATDICQGTPLSYEQLNASAVNATNTLTVLAGTFYYHPNVGTVLSEGQHQPLNVTFVPVDSKTYNNSTKTVYINVNECPEKHGFFHQTEYSTFLPFQWG
jgi:hypothetical protein